VTLDAAAVTPDTVFEEDVEFLFSQPNQQTENDITGHSPLKLAAEMAENLPRHISLSPPFDIPEAGRIKNTLIEPRQHGGVWISVFRDLADGQGKWDIVKEFLAV
jgi:hypothetical protein